MAVPGLDIVGPFPGELQGNFVFSAAIGARTRSVERARELVSFLRTAASQRVIRAKGMEPIAH
jgi:molybdate transport system substrate-binding protein